MKYLKLFEDIENQYLSHHDHITCPYCLKEQTHQPWEIIKYGVGEWNCEYCDKKFQVEKEEIYHSSKISNFSDYTQKRG